MRAECLFTGIRYKLIAGSLDRDVSDVADDSRNVTELELSRMDTDLFGMQ